MLLLQIPSMTTGGIFWFTDLTAADPSYALPIITFSMFLLAVELGSADGMQGQSPKAIKTFKNVMRGIVLIAIPFSSQLSAVSALTAMVLHCQLQELYLLQLCARWLQRS